MLSPVGNGNPLVVIALLAWSIPMSALGQAAWEHAQVIDLDPGQSSVALVTQKGIDLAIRVKSGDRVVHSFDGPDSTYGTEVVLLSNPGSGSSRYTIELQRTVKGPDVDYDIAWLPDPSPDEQLVAKALTLASQAWKSNQDARDTLTILEPIATQPVNSRLRQLAFLAYIDALAKSGQGSVLLASIESSQNSGDFSNSDRAYLDWHLAEALWKARENEQALRTIERITTRISAADYLDSIDSKSRLWLELNIASTLGKCLIFRGINTGEKSYTLRAGEIFKAALERANTSNDLILKASLTSSLSGFYDRLEGRNSVVRNNLLKQSATLYEEAGNERGLITIRNNQAHAAVGRGELSLALKLYTEALELQKYSKHLEGKAHVRARLGYVYYTLGDFRNAEIRFQESLELYESLGLDLTAVHTELEFADLLYAQKKYDDAIALLLSVEAKLNGYESMQDKLRTYTQLATNYLALNMIDRAIELASRAESVIRSETVSENHTRPIGPPLFYVLAYEILQANISFAQGDLDAANRLVSSSLSRLQSGTDEPLQHLGLLFLKIQIQAAQEDFSGMLITGERALSIIDTVGSNIDFQRFGPQWISRTNSIRAFLATRLLTNYEKSNSRAQLDKAFHLFQQVKATKLRIQRRSPNIVDEDPSISEVRDDLQAKRQQLIAALLKNDETVEIERELARLEEQFLFRQQIQDNEYSVDTLSTIENIQSMLDSAALYRAYVTYKNVIFILDIYSDNVILNKTVSGDEIYSLIGESTSEIQRRSIRNPNSQILAEHLTSGMNLSGIDTVLLEPDSAFARLPFGYFFSLTYPTSEISPAIIPSISEYLSPREGSFDIDTDQQVVVLADPELGTTSSSDGNGPVTIGWWEVLGRLPYSRQEALSIREVFADHSPLLYLDESASVKNLFSEQSRNARILHVATHGFASPEDPFFLGLVLHGLGNENSGLVTTDHITNHKFTNQLVVISACETGEGVALNGAGIMSLSRAFMASGASATISTLWPVSDRATARFMRDFYLALREPSMTTQKALRYAQQQLRNTPTYRAPFYWGGFVLNVADASFNPLPIQ